MSTAEIFDRGDRRFEGERAGVVGAVRSLAWHTTRSILGLGRKARHKIFPVIVILIAFLPAIIFIGIAALFPVDLFEDSAPEFYELSQISWFAILLFCAMVVPEALVRDRRDGMIALDLSTPLNRLTYILGKISAVMGTLMIVTVGPALLFLLAVTFEGQGPDGAGTWLKTIGQIILAGTGMAAVFASVGLAAASLTDRRAFASVATVLILIGSLAVTSALVEAADFSEDVRLFDVINVALEFAPRVFDAGPDPFNEDRPLSETDGLRYMAAVVGWIGASGLVVWGRYRRISAV